MIRNANEIGLNINIYCNKINYESSYLSEKLIFFRDCTLPAPIESHARCICKGIQRLWCMG